MATPDEVMVTVSGRIPTSLMERLDGVVDLLRNESPLLRLNRSDGLRLVIEAGCEALEERLGKPRGKVLGRAKAR